MDASKRIARVTAAELPGATLETYRELETRVAADNPDWRIDLIPPAGATLPTVAAGPNREQNLSRAPWLWLLGVRRSSICPFELPAQTAQKSLRSWLPPASRRAAFPAVGPPTSAGTCSASQSSRLVLF